MITLRSRSVAMLMLTALASHRVVAAQSPGDRTAVGVATLVDVEQRIHARPNALSSRTPLFDPTIVRGWWDNGIHPDTVGPPRIRDSMEVATLAAALRAHAVTAEMARDCGGVPIRMSCSNVSRDAYVFALSDARIAGDSATILVRSGPPYYIGSYRPGGGRSGSIGLVRLARQNGHWTVLCSAGAGTDATPPASQVEARCAASMRGPGRGN